MGLAPYGKPIYVDQLRDAFFSDINDPFSLNLDKSIFEIKGSANNFSYLQNILASEGIHLPLDCNKVSTTAANLAASIQTLLEETVLNIVHNFSELIKNYSNNVVFGGGVALNCKMVRYIYDNTNYNIHVPNSPGDAGSSIGACSSYLLKKNRRGIDKEINSQKLLIPNYSGSNISNISISEISSKCKLLNLKVDLDNDHFQILQLLKDFKIGAWCEGRSEFGPRALGHRSIICRHDHLNIKDVVNSRIKHRESFRPFAGIFTEKQALDNFDLMFEELGNLKYINRMHYAMTTVAKSKGLITKTNSSIIHHDDTCRLQILERDSNCDLISLLEKLSTSFGIVGLLNTSLNINGEPNCESFDDVLETFYSAKLDFIFINGLLIQKQIRQ